MCSAWGRRTLFLARVVVCWYICLSDFLPSNHNGIQQVFNLILANKCFHGNPSRGSWIATERVYLTGVCTWSDGRSRGTRGRVVCPVPSSAEHVSYVCFSPDDHLIAMSADKLIYIVDIQVCTTYLNSKILWEFTYYHRAFWITAFQKIINHFYTTCYICVWSIQWCRLANDDEAQFLSLLLHPW